MESGTELNVMGRVGLLGPTYVGKTTYFAVLDRALRDLDWRVEPHDSAGAKSSHLLNHIRRHLDNGYFPPKTKDQVPNEGLYFRVSKDNKVFELNFFDPPGEIFEPRGDEFDVDVQKVVFESIQEARGVLILLNLEKTPHKLTNIWRHSIESFFKHVRQSNDPGSLIQDDRLAIRTAVVFTKADQLPWMARHRSRDASAWLLGNEGLKTLAHDIHGVCSNVRFFFGSAVGWNRGRQNCRAVIEPREVWESESARVGDLIPDPFDDGPRASDGGSRPASMNPLFSDPLRLVDQQFDGTLASGQTGVIMLPGRNRPEDERERFLRPWNTVEPLLWAAGFDEP